MRSSIFLLAALAGFSVASPIQRRGLVQASGWSESYVNGEKKVTTWTTQYEEGGATAAAAATPAAAPAPASYPEQAANNGNSSPGPAAASAVPTSAPAASSGSGGSNSYQSAILAHHNAHRANHSASPLEWDDDLASWAQQIGQTCTFAHSKAAGDGNYGQNIAAGVTPADAGNEITSMYDSEMPLFASLYGSDSPSGFEAWGHFTQIVWKATTKVGCATVDCSASGLGNTGSGIPPWFTVCNYKTPGNFAGAYADNVGKPLGQPSYSD